MPRPDALSAEEIRVLGCLVEKEMTTPDNYPLSSNALVNACNQTTSRDPIVHYSEREIDQVMLHLREYGLARTVRGDGQRVHKHKHVLGEALGSQRPSLALLSVLMLRGPQTVNELKTRTERHETGLDHDGVERALQSLAGGEAPLVRLLPRRSGEREARWVHLLGGEAMADASAAAPAVSSASHRARRGPPAPRRSPQLRARLDELDASLRRELLERLGEAIDCRLATRSACARRSMSGWVHRWRIALPRSSRSLVVTLLVAIAACSGDGDAPSITGTSAPTTTTIPFAVTGDDVYSPPDPLPAGEHGDLVWAQPVASGGAAHAGRGRCSICRPRSTAMPSPFRDS